jgi:hypothetical protein
MEYNLKSIIIKTAIRRSGYCLGEGVNAAMLKPNELERLDHYTGYKGLPPLMDLLPLREAVSKGLPVLEVAERLKRMHWAMRTAHRVMLAHLAGMPIYELKMALSLHAYYCAEHIEAFALRIREMRQPPYGLDGVPAAALALCGDELLATPTTPALLLGLYEVLFPELQQAVERLLRDTNKLFDYPTYRVCRHALLELEEVNAYGVKALTALVSDADREELQPWIELLHSSLAASGGLDGTAPVNLTTFSPQFSAKPYVYDGTPKRDERFIDPYNMGVNAEALLFDREIPSFPKTLMLFYKRMREINVPEVMASILFETPDKPWGYYRDMTRQLWDEARHAMMGEVGFASLGMDWRKIPFDLSWSHNLNTRLSPIERHAVLFTIEQGLMPKDKGKEYEWEVAVASASPLAQLIQDYDWADENLHARIGRDWLVTQIGTQEKALAFGDKAWSNAVDDWSKWREKGLTNHHNWWPEIYDEACFLSNVKPDPKTQAFHVTYEGIRPDQVKTVA